MKEPLIKNVVIMGAGPAGITAATELHKHNIKSTLIEKESQPGGLARTIKYKGYRFDIGGHRFFTKMPKIQKWWEDILDTEFLRRNRLSRIFYKEKYLSYPLKISNILSTLGLVFCVRAFISYLSALKYPRKPEISFEDWIINHFGKMLYNEFFKDYTEKVWGISCAELSSDWAAQRIRGLSFSSALRSLISKKIGTKIKTLTEYFYYPRLGPGQMWETAINKISDKTDIYYDQTIKRIEWEENYIRKIISQDKEGAEKIYEGDHYISSISMQDLIHALGNKVPQNVINAANFLNYRDFITVALIIKKPEIIPDNWLYINNSNVKVGRIQNFKNWSPDLVPDINTTCLGLEYFCFKGDDFWKQSDQRLIEQAKEEIDHLKLASKSDVFDAKVIRIEQAYPTYDKNYERNVNTVRHFLGEFKNLQLIGRNGMHKYNNQDHAMLTAMLAVENILGAENNIWKVNSVEEYHEN